MLLFALNLELKKTNSWNFENMINDICTGIVFISVWKKWGGGCHHWNIEKGLSQTLKMEVWSKMFRKIRVKCFIPLTKVNIPNFDYDHNIVHEF